MEMGTARERKKVTANASNFLNQNEILDPGVIERINGKRANRKSFMGQSSNKQEGRVVLLGRLEMDLPNGFVTLEL